MMSTYHTLTTNQCLCMILYYYTYSTINKCALCATAQIQHSLHHGSFKTLM